MRETWRTKIPTGFKCNIKCRFCYYGDLLTSENPPTERIKSMLDYAKKRGIKDIDFSGGESTLRKDFPELVSYARSLEFRTICVITNGLLMSNESYVEKLADAGLNEVLFSINGHGAEMHDFLTGVPGSFEKLMRAVKNVKRLGIKFRTNTVVTKPNFEHMPELAELLVELRPSAVNFISFNPWCFARAHVGEITAKYSELAPYLKKAINILEPHIQKITVRYIPFCFMQGYEKYVCDYRQLKYDPDEWAPRIIVRLESGPVKYRLYILGGLIRYHPFNRLQKFTMSELFDEIAIKGYQRWYFKTKACVNCKHHEICDGIEKSYAKVFGLSEIKPAPGKRVQDPMFYRENYLLP